MTDEPDPRHKVAGLFDQLAPQYDRGPVPWFGPIAERLVALVAPAPGESVLDVGCGRGAVTFRLAEAVSPDGRVTAVDLSPVMIDLLRREALGRGHRRIESRVGEASVATLGPAAYDVVTASLVLVFDPDPEATLRAWVGLMRPGTGRLGVTTFGPIDAGWQRAEDAVLAHAPAGLLDPRTSGRRGPFASLDTLADLMRASGAVEVDSYEEPLKVVLADAAAWRDWTMSLGMRQFWDAVPLDRLPGVLDEVAAALVGNRAEDGPLHLTQQVRYTIGRAA